jgi:hypothetical protein
VKPSAAEVARYLQRVRAALEQHGLILCHDAKVASVTGMIAGEPIVGSWWGHAKGALIYAVFSALDAAEATSVKLLKGKRTLVSRRLFPALVSVGQAEERWQLEGLRDDARSIWDQVRKHGALPQRAFERPSGTRKLPVLLTDLEQRLLVYAESAHTESGAHERVVMTWAKWQTAHALTKRALPDPKRGKQLLSEAAASWGKSVAEQLPWRGSKA